MKLCVHTFTVDEHKVFSLWEPLFGHAAANLIRHDFSKD